MKSHQHVQGNEMLQATKPNPPQLAWFKDAEGYVDYEAFDHAETQYLADLAEWEWAHLNPEQSIRAAFDKLEESKEAQIELMWSNR